MTQTVGAKVFAAARRLADITFEIAAKERAFQAARKEHSAEIESLEDERQRLSDDIRTGHGSLLD